MQNWVYCSTLPFSSHSPAPQHLLRPTLPSFLQEGKSYPKPHAVFAPSTTVSGSAPPAWRSDLGADSWCLSPTGRGASTCRAAGSRRRSGEEELLRTRPWTMSCGDCCTTGLAGAHQHHRSRWTAPGKKTAAAPQVSLDSMPR